MTNSHFCYLTNDKLTWRQKLKKSHFYDQGKENPRQFQLQDADYHMHTKAWPRVPVPAFMDDTPPSTAEPSPPDTSVSKGLSNPQLQQLLESTFQMMDVCKEFGLDPVASYTKDRYQRILEAVVVGCTKCEICGKVLSHHLSLKNHIETQHMLSTDYTCNTCNTSFSRKSSYSAHMRKHSVTSRIYRCNHPIQQENGEVRYCEFVAVEPARVRQHREVHGEGFPCDFCNKIYSAKRNLTGHLKVCPKNPNKEERVTCMYCPKTFGRKQDANRYIGNKHQGRPKFP